MNPEIKNPGGSILEGTDAALTIERTYVKGDASFGNSGNGDQPLAFRGRILTGSFTAYGVVSLEGSHIDGNLDLRKSSLRSTKLTIELTTVSSVMCGTSWPAQGNLLLDGFVYERIADAPPEVETMLRWLDIMPDQPFRPQPYLQLAKVLRESGNDEGERRVLVAMEDRRWKADHPSAYALRLPLKLTAGYGYRPLWAFWEIAGLSVLGWIIYRRSYLAGSIVPSDKEAYEYFKREGRPPPQMVAFSPMVYSVENSLPLVKLGQADKWQPDPSPNRSVEKGLSVPKPGRTRAARLRFLPWVNRGLLRIGLSAAATRIHELSSLFRIATSARFLRWFLLFQILLGWLLATLFFAGVTGLIRKE